MAVTSPADTLAAGVRAVLAAATGTELTGAEVRRLTGGASREIYAVRATDSAGREISAVLRRDPPGRGEIARMRAEVACLRAAAAAGVPVPEVLASGDTAPGIDAPYLVMNTVPGEALPRRLQRDPHFASVRTHLAEDFGYVLGLVHRTPVATLTALDDRDPLDAIEKTYRDLAEPRPAVEIGLRWLRDNRPPDRPAGLVHGDFRLGNLLIDADGIRGVLDWELAHLGNPIEDLGWLCVRAWRFGAAAPVGGLGTRDQLLDGYRRATGDRPSAAELHWWEVFGTLKWLVLSRFQAERHLGGTEHSLELAAIGRRVCESEYDLLDVLGLLGKLPGDSAPHTPASTVHDRPDLTEILEIVTETLTGEIGPALPEDAAAQRYLLRICASLLQIGGRELRAGSGPTERLHEMLRALDCPSEATLAERLRSGALSVADERVRSTVTAAVEARLQVANPRRLG
ncbi:phosphotransferase family protein [Nocardia carnea]|uniref:phosphotransferase family protein n=1 Tax=Nocardia carnea TaxID=37328 RepID=UPI0024585AF5|nr:phosphotransferase family protein [Nocardia carnea]